MLLTILVSFVTIIFTWLIAFPIGIYSATHQYSWGDYGLTFLGLLGIAIPNFLLALVLMYFANVWFGTSIGGLMDPQYLDQPMSWAKVESILEHLWIPVLVIGTGGTAGMIRRLRANLLDELQKQYVIDRARQGPASVQGAGQISAAHGAQLLHLRHRLASCRRSSRAPRSRRSCCRWRRPGRCSSRRCRARTCIWPARS